MSYRPTAVTEVTVTANNQFSSSIDITDIFNVAIRGAFTATITLQASFDNGVNWIDVEIFSEPVVKRGRIAPNEVVQFRIGSTAYTSGTASCRISR
jgi:hypothetical protein